MSGLYLLFPTLLAIFISFLVVRAGAIALMMTGLDRNRAVFQALSAFSGTGFTTRESEHVANHPQRRKIVSWLMILGNAGIVTVIVTATSSLATSERYEIPLNVMIMIVGVYIIYRMARSKGFVGRWENFIEERLVRSAIFEEEHVEDLLHLIEGYGLLKVILSGQSSLAGKTLRENELTKKGLLVLGIERGKDWIPVPRPSEVMMPGDRLTIYGPLETLKPYFKERL